LTLCDTVHYIDHVKIIVKKVLKYNYVMSANSPLYNNGYMTDETRQD